ncbi:hypothetical protein Cni_G29484 [Canna indica]|uniref:MULE transposase domain-containing protein n=1 Tax=Canna indica TaxID=4628 RepID=A0AAQ3L588_9LILI|nr:hypothetical protein Cni_G29484 [Canna indica]
MSIFSIVCNRAFTGAPPVFQQLYIGFDALKKGFMLGCRPIIGFDGCFLKTFLGGQLLAAVGRDGNNQMFPLVWTVVEGENYDSCSWFLGILFDDLSIDRGYGLTLISDQQNRVMNELQATSPRSHEDFISVGVTKFCQACMISSSCKSDVVSNNINETFNGYILKARSKPIIDMLEDI